MKCKKKKSLDCTPPCCCKSAKPKLLDDRSISMLRFTFGNKCGRYITLVACFIYLIFGNIAFAVMTDNELEE